MSQQFLTIGLCLACLLTSSANLSLDGRCDNWEVGNGFCWHFSMKGIRTQTYRSVEAMPSVVGCDKLGLVNAFVFFVGGRLNASGESSSEGCPHLASPTFSCFTRGQQNHTPDNRKTPDNVDKLNLITINFLSRWPLSQRNITLI